MKPLECSYFETNRCNSCTLLGVTVAEAIRAKQKALQDLVKRALSTECIIDPIFSPSTIFPSRSKAKLAVTGTVGNPVVGFVRDDQSSQELLSCPLHLPLINKIGSFITENLISAYGLVPYDIDKRIGELKYLIITSNHDMTEAMVRFVVRSHKLLPEIEKVSLVLRASFPEVRVITANIQPAPAAILEGGEEILLTKERSISEMYDGFTLEFYPKAFMQVTFEAANELYKSVRSYVLKHPHRQLLDLYCGVGGFSFAAAPGVKDGIGIELSEEAVSAANVSAKSNNAHHISFKSGDVDKLLRDPALGDPDIIVANPPRRGLSPQIIDTILNIAPDTFIYSSCNPESLVRDLSLMLEMYRIEKLSPFDMFPMTEHLEVLAVLVKKSKS